MYFMNHSLKMEGKNILDKIQKFCSELVFSIHHEEFQ